MGKVLPTICAVIVVAGTSLSLDPTPAQGQGQAAEPWEAACIMRHLDPNGDGFLSIRTGPGSQYQEIARVSNGDSMPIDTRKCQGKWCYAESINMNGQRRNMQGWFHTGWCEMIP